MERFGLSRLRGPSVDVTFTGSDGGTHAEHSPLTPPRSRRKVRSPTNWVAGAVRILKKGERSEQSEEKMAVYVEYPVYIAGNLEQWLRNKPREEWEQQSAAQHLISALAFIHDHGLVHNAIRSTNILISEYGHPVLADF